MTREEFENIAYEYKNSLLANEKDVIVFVEDKASKKFWTNIFSKFVPSLQIDCVYEGRFVNRQGNEQTQSGVAYISNYLPFTDCQLIVCKDSDYDYLLQTPHLNNRPYLFQTYTYSVENYLCYAPSLKEICFQGSQNSEIDFDIESFFREYSKIVYDLLLWVYQDEEEREKMFEVIFLPARMNIDETEKILQDIQEKVAAKIEALKQSKPDFDIDNEKSKVSTLGVQAENAYLYIRGHNLYDSVTKTVLASLIKRLQTQKITEIREQYDNEEIEEQREAYLATTKDLEEALSENTNYFDCPLMDKIKQDIEEFMENCFPDRIAGSEGGVER